MCAPEDCRNAASPGRWSRCDQRAPREGWARSIGVADALANVFRSVRTRCMPKRRERLVFASTRCTTRCTATTFWTSPTVSHAAMAVLPGSTDRIFRASNRMAVERCLRELAQALKETTCRTQAVRRSGTANGALSLPRLSSTPPGPSWTSQPRSSPAQVRTRLREINRLLDCVAGRPYLAGVTSYLFRGSSAEQRAAGPRHGHFFTPSGWHGELDGTA